MCLLLLYYSCFFFFNHPPTTEIYTLSLHDALPIYRGIRAVGHRHGAAAGAREERRGLQGSGRAGSAIPERPPLSRAPRDRKSTRLNSSHVSISYAVFCLKKKK